MSVPDQFSSVTALTRANVYFDGKVVSHTIFLADGSKKTLGVVLPGVYSFDTNVAERMEIVQGRARVTLPGTTNPVQVIAGESFDVPAKALFTIDVEAEPLHYVCSYLG